MRKLLLFLTSFLFGISASIFSLLLLGALIFKTPASIENALVKSQAYPVVSEYVNKNVTRSLSSNAPLTLALHQEFSPEYIQHKTEQFLRDTYNYAENKTQKLPASNLTDLKNNLIRRVPSFYYIARQYSSLFDQEFSIPQDKANDLRYYYNAYHQALAASFLTSLLLFLTIFLLGQNASRRLKLLAKELLKVSLPGLIGAVIALIILSRVSAPNITVPETIAFLKQPITNFSLLITARLLAVSILMYGWVALIAVIFLLAGRIITPFHKPTPPPAKQ